MRGILGFDTFSHVHLKTTQIYSAWMFRLTATRMFCRFGLLSTLIFKDYIFKDSNLCLHC